MKKVNIDVENLHNFWTTWEILKRFSKDVAYDNIKN